MTAKGQRCEGWAEVGTASVCLEWLRKDLEIRRLGCCRKETAKLLVWGENGFGTFQRGVGWKGEGDRVKLPAWSFRSLAVARSQVFILRARGSHWSIYSNRGIRWQCFRKVILHRADWLHKPELPLPLYPLQRLRFSQQQKRWRDGECACVLCAQVLNKLEDLSPINRPFWVPCLLHILKFLQALSYKILELFKLYPSKK